MHTNSYLPTWRSGRALFAIGIAIAITCGLLAADTGPPATSGSQGESRLTFEPMTGSSPSALHGVADVSPLSPEPPPTEHPWEVSPTPTPSKPRETPSQTPKPPPPPSPPLEAPTSREETTSTTPHSQPPPTTTQQQIPSTEPVAPLPSPPPTPQPSPAPSTKEPTEAKAEVHTEEGFPPFDYALHPVAEVPNWGAMRTPEEWNRRYGELEEEDFVAIPRYDLAVLTTPLSTLTAQLSHSTNITKVTAKLYYSTRFFGAYDLDASEFTAVHPGIDLKLARGTPIGAIGGGKVHTVRTNKNLGLHVIIEHRIPDEGAYYSIYGHLDVASVKVGKIVRPGQMIGTVGMTGTTFSPHLHLQVDVGSPGETEHVVYFPDHLPSPAEARRWAAHPISFILSHAKRR